jgi:rhodanese-related sulfurtransferase
LLPDIIFYFKENRLETQKNIKSAVKLRQRAKVNLNMQKYFSIMACAFLMLGCTTDTDTNTDTQAQPQATIQTVAPAAFKALAESKDYTVIDVRSPEETAPQNGGKIYEDALNINFYEPNFAEEIKALDRDKKYLLYCRSGSRSGKTAAIMQAAGFENITHLEGGKMAWDTAYGS